MHYKPCPIISLSSRSWDTFALSIDKNDFLIFSYLNLRAHLWAQITQEGRLQQRSCNFFWILHSWINNSWLVLFWFRPIFDKFLGLKLKVLKNDFGTRTLKSYRTVNTLPKVIINSPFWRKQIAKLFLAFTFIKNDHF